MATWTAQTTTRGHPDEVLTVLTDPDEIARWAPIPFELVDFDGQRLIAGDKVRVRGALGGPTVQFEVEVAEADDGRLALTATGPIRLDVEYEAVATDHGSQVRASVAVSGSGLRGRILARATDALLAGGALTGAVRRIADQLAPARIDQFAPVAVG
jgi:polyketide cyclase/dehydrase/lipid transport protein